MPRRFDFDQTIHIIVVDTGLNIACRPMLKWQNELCDNGGITAFGVLVIKPLLTKIWKFRNNEKGGNDYWIKKEITFTFCYHRGATFSH
jgi:hypothetical protein